MLMLHAWVCFCTLAAVCLMCAATATDIDCRCCVQVNDTIMLDIETGRPKEIFKFELGNICMVTGGANNG